MKASSQYWCVIVVCLAACVAFAQTKPSHPGQAPNSQPSTATVVSNPAVSTATVESFLKSMFGYDSNITWKIQNIVPTEMPGVTKVDVAIGNQPRTTFYVMPGGRFVILGEVIPFGADPFAEARQKLQEKADGPARGPANAPVTVVEFSDLQCPHCKAAQPVLDRVLAEMPDVRLVFQNFPLPMHPWAEQAAGMAHCVAQQSNDAFWKFVESVYESQAEITETNAGQKLSELAAAAGADPAKAVACQKSPKTFLAVNTSVQLGKDLGVTGTPTIFINGRKLTGINEMPFDTLKAMITYAARQSQNQ